MARRRTSGKAGGRKAARRPVRSTSGDMTAEDMRGWLERHELTIDSGAEALGISRRALFYYLNGRRIPRYVELLCEAYDSGWAPD
jgi:hypothetical protein